MFRKPRLYVGGAVVFVVTLVAAPHARALQQKPPAVARFGDITITGPVHMHAVLNRYLIVTGSPAIVDVILPEPGGRKLHLESPKIVVHFDPKKQFKVATLEADGQVHFLGTQTQPKSADRLDGTGSHAVYSAAESTLKVAGPVSYTGDQTTPEHVDDSHVRGTADQATYDIAHNRVVLSGAVKAWFRLGPATAEEAPVVADSATIDLAQSPISFTLESATVGPYRYAPKPAPQH